MESDMDDLVNRWKTEKKQIKPVQSVSDLIAAANQKKKSSLQFHYGNIIVLVLVAIMLLVFFLVLFPFQEVVSKAGVALMVGGLLIRIGLELYSSVRSSRIDLSSTALKVTEDTVKFYRFRKTIHGPVTITIVVLYIVGLFMLTPEFLKHVGKIIFLFDALFLVAAVILFWQIRKAILKEMKDLQDIIELNRQIVGKE